VILDHYANRLTPQSVLTTNYLLALVEQAQNVIREILMGVSTINGYRNSPVRLSVKRLVCALCHGL